MPPADVPRSDALRHRRAAAAFAGATVLAFIPLDVGLGASLPVALGLRLAWVAAVVMIAWLPQEERRWHPDALGVVSAVALAGAVHATGGPASLYLGYLYALPLALLALYPGQARAGMLTGLASTTAGASMLLVAGSPARDVAAFALTAASSGFMAAFSGRVYRMARDAELAAGEAHRRAVEELAASERRRARTERLALMGQLAAGVAHEVNNPLSYVKTSLGVVEELTAPLALAPADREELEGAVADARAGLARIQAIVSDLRAFARGDDDRVERCDAAQALEEALRVASVRVSRVARVEAAVAPGAREVAIPRSRLVQALVNVLVNAADAIEAGRRGGTVRVTLRDEPQACAIEIADDGPGVPPEVVPRLFEPFFTTKGAKGTGLGLSLSREYLARYGAAISHAPAPGGGAAFTVRIPVLPGAPAAAPPGAAAA